MLSPRLPFALILPVVLAACGGGGGGSSTPPVEEPPFIDPNALSSIGYAPTNIQGISDGVTFRQPAVASLSVENGQTSISETDITIRVDGVGSLEAAATITVDGEEFVVPFRPNNRFEDGNLSLFLDRDYNGVRLARLDVGDVTSTTASGTSTIFVRGFDVDPVKVAERTGFGFYDGVASALALRDGENPGDPRLFSNGDGTVRVVVDFDEETVTGQINIDATEAGAVLAANEFAFPRTRVLFDLTPIDGNQFSGGLDLRIGDFGEGTTLADGSYDGRFYGLRSGSVGGTFDATLTTDTGPTTLVQGGFVADDPQQAGTGRFD